MRVALAALFGWVALGSHAAEPQGIPADRPRARPPSALTGWADWEKGAELLKRIQVPPAPPLSPEEAMKTFKLAPGYRLELVASEPMVQNPIFFEFDPDGRIWVVEYQGYMRDLKGSGEGEPICRLVVLEDTDENGQADKQTVFLDKLVMPRSFAFVKGGVLLLEPPKLYFCEDTNNDLRCDKKTEVGSMGVAGNPQHTANGLRYGIDNWLHNADWPKRHRWTDGKLVEENTVHRGQFGVSFDQSGRFLSCYENSPLHADLIPAHYLQRNPALVRIAERSGRTGVSGVNVNIATDANEVFPIRVTPAVTLGALELRDDGRLRTYTIVSGSCFYDGDQFPPDARGNAFIPESGGHLLGRLKLTSGIRPAASRYYPPEQELLASTDERFRPVNARVGPDGALYVADFYHGIIEHIIFMVPWLTDQIRERKLDTGNDMGRIYRLVHEGNPIPRKAPALGQAATAELVTHLGHANGWWRLTAQRLLVERRDPQAVSALLNLLQQSASPTARLHALWTLDGMDALDAETKLRALEDADDYVRSAALRLCEAGLDATQEKRLLGKLSGLVRDTSEVVRLQATLTASTLRQPEALPLVTDLVASGDDALFPIAAMTGMHRRELGLIRHLLKAEHPLPSLLALAVRCLAIEDESTSLAELMKLVDELPAAQAKTTQIILSTLASTPGKVVSLAKEPALLARLRRSGDVAQREQSYALMERFTWPGATMLSQTTGSPAPHQSKLEAGRACYALYCAPCHQATGSGAAGVAPRLAGSEWVNGPPERLARIVLHGLYGPVEVNGQAWNLAMPGLGVAGNLSDEVISSILSFIRQAWGNQSSPIGPQVIHDVREQTKSRTLPWTAAELQGTDADTSVVAIRPTPKGEFLLSGRDAVVFSKRLAYRPALDVLAPWVAQEDLVEWHLTVPADSEYAVTVALAADERSAGDAFVVEVEGGRTTGTVPNTGGYETFTDQPAGKLKLAKGTQKLQLRAEGKLKQELADIRSVKLVPVR